ncbi:MAG TPA: methyltransferase domain-containing protein [Longimicrobiales bacterium]|nr:methyltransferase domain-containing protein [Longimicrobiales bacterium]
MLSQIPRAENAPELLDEPLHDRHELEQSLDHVAAVNRWLGGVRSLMLHVEPLLEDGVRVLDVGTGSADLPRRIVQTARRRNLQIRVTATDLHPQMRELAAARCAEYPEIEIDDADALALKYPDSSFDIATLSLTLHHFDGNEQLRVLQELARVAKVVVVNDLRRNRLNYVGAKLLGLTFWRVNRLTRHDGPLSVLRAFTPDELLQLSLRAGLQGRVYTHYFERVVLVAHA